MSICCEDRVFICDKRMFGTVCKTGVLGIKKSGSYRVICDDGKRYMYTGVNAKNVVNTVSCDNDSGEHFLLPIDLKCVGSSILKEEGYHDLKLASIYTDFSRLPDETHEEYRNTWSSVSSSEKKSKAFILKIAKELC